MARLPRLGRVLGIRISLHYTWILAFALITAIMVTQFPEAYPLWQRVALGVVTSLLFLIAVSVRSLIISFIAISRGIPVKRITLFVFGGGAEISKEATRPIIEVLLAATGLLTTLLLCGIFYGIYAILFNAGGTMFYVIIQWLSYIFFMLFLFHLIPGFPLDGGRLLRAFLWEISGNHDGSIRITSIMGWAIGWLLIAGGVLLLISEQQWFNGLAIAGTGWVLQSAAAQSRRRAALRQSLQAVKTQDIMSRESALINSQTTIGQLIHNYILATGQNYCIIADEYELKGVVTVDDAKRVPKKHRSAHVGKIMIPATELITAHPHQSAASVLGLMDEQGVDNMPVVEENRVVGIISRQSLTQLAQIRGKLKL